MPNKRGLSRDIPDPVKREVLQRCGFGCIVCGELITDFHHFDPEFTEATLHRAEGITLLCDRHHRRTLTGILTPDQVREADDHPKAREMGFSTWTPDPSFWSSMTIGTDLVFGQSGLRTDQFEISIEPGAAEAPCTLDLKVWDSPKRDRLVLEVTKNEIRTNLANFIVHFTGSRLVVRPVKGHKVLELDLAAGKLVVSKFHLRSSNIKVANRVTTYSSRRSTPQTSSTSNKRPLTTSSSPAVLHIGPGSSATVAGNLVVGFPSAIAVASGGRAVVTNSSFNYCGSAFALEEGAEIESSRNTFMNVQEIVTEI